VIRVARRQAAALLQRVFLDAATSAQPVVSYDVTAMCGDFVEAETLRRVGIDQIARLPSDVFWSIYEADDGRLFVDASRSETALQALASLREGVSDSVPDGVWWGLLTGRDVDVLQGASYESRRQLSPHAIEVRQNPRAPYDTEFVRDVIRSAIVSIVASAIVTAGLIAWDRWDER